MYSYVVEAQVSTPACIVYTYTRINVQYWYKQFAFRDMPYNKYLTILTSTMVHTHIYIFYVLAILYKLLVHIYNMRWA